MTEQKDILPVPAVFDSDPQPQTHDLRRLIGYAGGVLVAAVIGAGFATDVVPDHIDLGPVQAAVRVEPSNIISGTFVGPHTLTARKHSPLEIVGAHLQVTDLNADFGSLTKKGTQSSAYAQLFTNFSHDKNLAVAKIERRMLEGADSGTLLAIAMGLGFPYARRRRTELYPKIQEAVETLKTFYGPRAQRIGAATAALAVMGAGVPTALLETQTVHPTTAFASFKALKGVEVSGGLAPLTIDAAEKVAANKTFYAKVTHSEQQVFTEEYAAQLPAGPHIVPILLYTDRHCNVGMDPVLAEEAKLYHVKLSISGGDDDFSGTFPFEFACTSELASYLKKLGVAEVAELGNHDSSKATDPNQSFNTADWEASEGIHVLDGSQITIKLSDGGSITILGSRDPRRSRLGHAIVTVGGGEQATALAEQGQTLGRTACANPKPTDILVTHDPQPAATAISDGCGKITFAFSGHLHEYYAPVPDGYNQLGQPVFRMTGGTSGGAKEDSPTFGPLEEPATSDILYWNTQTEQPVGTVHDLALPNGTVSFGNYTPLATTAPQPLQPRRDHDRRQRSKASRGSVRSRGR